MNHPHETTSSHLPILMEILKFFKIKTVLEFGPGLYSTKLFSSRRKRLFSIEMKSIAWFNFISKEMSKEKNKNIEIIFNNNFKLSTLKEKTFDLVLIDGDDRVNPANNCFGISDIIVVHDTQHQWSNEILNPIEYLQIVFNKFPIKYPSRGNMLGDNPWTTLYTKRNDIYEHFKNIQEETLYEKYKFPYVYKEVPKIFPKE